MRGKRRRSSREHDNQILMIITDYAIAISVMTTTVPLDGRARWSKSRSYCIVRFCSLRCADSVQRVQRVVNGECERAQRRATTVVTYERHSGAGAGAVAYIVALD